jgi:uncharacterized protein (TIGR03083 family)
MAQTAGRPGEVVIMLRTPGQSVAAYAGIRLRLTELLGDTPEDTAASTTVPACPDWTVTDVVAHLYGVEVDIGEGNLAGVGTAAWADDQVRRFAPLGLPQLLERWNETSPDFEIRGQAFPPAAAAQFVFDACTHEHDIRGALDLAGARDADSVTVGLTFVESALGVLVGERRLPALELDSPQFGTTIGTGPVTVRLSTSAFELLRAFSGRRSPPQIRTLPWQGDPTPYLGVFDHGPLKPPTLPLIE